MNGTVGKKSRVLKTAVAQLTGGLLIGLSLFSAGSVQAAEPEVSLTARTQGDTRLRDGALVAEGRVRVREAHSGVQVWLDAVKSGDAPDRYVLSGRNHPAHQLRVRLSARDSEADSRDGKGRILRTAEEQVRYEVVVDGDQQASPDEYDLRVRAAPAG
ncbi:AfaD family invasin [Serratia sp. 1D1416]|uniref:AfaD family invasin n=1 Tax=Serratia sp. 1D1416 TaxID=2447890 RepID=UPI0013ED3A62|nr:AfaD family invasin [Serratia sp. 1D1416]